MRFHTICSEIKTFVFILIVISYKRKKYDYLKFNFLFSYIFIFSQLEFLRHLKIFVYHSNDFRYYFKLGSIGIVLLIK